MWYVSHWSTRPKNKYCGEKTRVFYSNGFHVICIRRNLLLSFFLNHSTQFYLHLKRNKLYANFPFFPFFCFSACFKSPLCIKIVNHILLGFCILVIYFEYLFIFPFLFLFSFAAITKLFYCFIYFSMFVLWAKVHVQKIVSYAPSFEMMVISAPGEITSGASKGKLKTLA